MNTISKSSDEQIMQLMKPFKHYIHELKSSATFSYLKLCRFTKSATSVEQTFLWPAFQCCI